MYSHLRNVRLGTLCLRGHDHAQGKSYRHIGNGTCVQCQRERIAHWAKSEAGRKSHAATKKRCTEKKAVSSAAYRQRERAKIDRYNRAYRTRRRLWYISYYRNYNARRRAALRNATPPWADMEQIKAIYESAALMTLTSGVEYQVDHIVPLVSKEVCGLHVPANLRILTKSENSRKKNRRVPEWESATNGLPDRTALWHRTEQVLTA